MSTGQHRRAGEPLRQRLTKFVSSATGNHRRRGQVATQPSIRSTTAEEHTHGHHHHTHRGNTANGAAA